MCVNSIPTFMMWSYIMHDVKYVSVDDSRGDGIAILLAPSGNTIPSTDNIHSVF